MSGFRAMLWKETRELFWPAGRPTGMFLGGLAGAVVFGLMPHFFLLPFDDALSGNANLGPPGSGALLGTAVAASGMLYAATFSWMGVLGLAPESFAGEKERHTMETLLASRLSDQEILYGKMVAISLYGLTLAAISIVTYTVVLVFRSASTPEFLLTVALGLGSLIGAIPVGLLLLLMGTLISLKAKTVKGANQAMALAIMPVIFLPMFFLFAAPRLLPLVEDDPRAFAVVGLVIGLSVPALIIAADVVLFVMVRRAFRRDRLLGA